MNAIVGIILVVVVLFAVYYMYQAGFFAPITGIIGDISVGYNAAYNGYQSPTSTYYHQVRIGFVALGTGTGGVGDLVALSVHPKQGGFKMTGWTLKTDKGNYKIPQVYNIYSPSTSNAAPEDIFARDGDRLTLYGGASPNGRNERVTQGEYRIWLGDFLAKGHGTITLNDDKGIQVDQYVY